MARGLILLALLLAGCAKAAPPTLVDGSTEAALPVSIWPADPSLVGNVACPDLDTELVEQTTTCTAVIDTDPITVDVVVDENGVAAATVLEPLFVVDAVAEQLAERLADDLGIREPLVDCARAVVVATAGLELTCVASRDDRVIEFALHLVDGDGGWEITFD